MLDDARQRALREAGRGRVAFDVPMAGYSTLRAGGRAAALAEVDSLELLAALLQCCAGEQIAWRVIGRGSNILVRDEGYPGLVLRLKGGCFEEISCTPAQGQLRAGAGCSATRLLAACREQGLGGLEFLVGIPGSVGGMVRLNAGAHGREIGDTLRTLALVDGQGRVLEIGADRLRCGYRETMIRDLSWDSAIVVGADFHLQPCRPGEIAEKMARYAEKRAGQPLSQPSAGSFFRNPPGDFAGRLIEACGLKGACVGGAMVSPHHANFIVNRDGTATATDILELMRLIQEKVEDRFSVLLEPEVHIF